MSYCAAVVEQVFISINLVNTLVMLLIGFLVIYRKKYRWWWLWVVFLIIMVLMATFSSYSADGCERSGVFWNFELFPTRFGLDLRTYYYLYKYAGYFWDEINEWYL